MASHRINRIRWPDEFRYALNSVAENFARYAQGVDEKGTIRLEGLSPQQALAHDILMLGSEADEVIGNLNIVLSDIERLSDDPKTFHDRNPFDRFQLLVRMYFYEYGRFEDVFGYFTQWKQQRGLMTKQERKDHRQSFYSTYEDAIKTRNVMLHDLVSWREQSSPEIAILQGLEAVGKVAIDRSGKELTWRDHMKPLCQKTLPMMLTLGQHMQVFWNMELAHLALVLVEKGHLQKATKPYVGRDTALFMKVDPDYR
jgi:hypothetical protein